MTSELRDRAAKIKLLLMDVDGVLTDGHLINVPGPDGKMHETKMFDSQDGIALQWLHWNGIQTGVISGRVSPATEERARQVKMTYVYQGHIEKIPILEEIIAKSGVGADQIAYAGDDLTDVVIMRQRHDSRTLRADSSSPGPLDGHPAQISGRVLTRFVREIRIMD